MRIQYRCTCDRCKTDIDKVNDENDVTMNATKYVFCPSCFAMISELFTSLLETDDKVKV